VPTLDSVGFALLVLGVFLIGVTQRKANSIDMTANHTQERSVDHRGAQPLRTGIVAGRSDKR
jgi:hypothetical protein